VSPEVQTPASQDVPLAAFVWLQVLVEVSHVSIVQGLPSSQSASVVQQPRIGWSPQPDEVQMALLQVDEGQLVPQVPQFSVVL
jgi:hypothetical protein